MAERDLYAEKPFYKWLALAAALMAWGFDGVEQNVYALMTRAALKDLIPGPVQEGDISFYFSLSMAMWLWGAAVGGVWFGRMGDKYGRVRSLLFAVVTYSIFTGLSAFSGHWTHLAAYRFLGALGLGGTWPLCVALVVETWPEKNRAVLAGAIGSAANVGYLIAAIYSKQMLAHGANWRWIIGMGFVIGLLSLPVIWFVPEPTKWKQSKAKHQKVPMSELFAPQYRRGVIVGSLLSTVALLGTWGSFLWLATYVDKIAEGTALAGTAKATVSQWQSIGQMTGGFFGGILAGWLGNKRSWCLLCVATWVSVMALFGLNTSFEEYKIGVMAMIAGLFVTAYFGWLPKYLPELFPTHIRATGQGFAYNIGRVLTGLGVLGAGKLAQVFDGDYRRAAMTMASVYLLGLIVIAFAPDTGGKMRADEAT
ncbi:MAG: MFS transporter [Verrucomicrobia bacterium]|jgi:MFS family permease|nr:MFS transporter [Verrucomicrobiota bacterium]